VGLVIGLTATFKREKPTHGDGQTPTAALAPIACPCCDRALEVRCPNNCEHATMGAKGLKHPFKDKIAHVCPIEPPHVERKPPTEPVKRVMPEPAQFIRPTPPPAPVSIDEFDDEIEEPVRVARRRTGGGFGTRDKVLAAIWDGPQSSMDVARSIDPARPQEWIARVTVMLSNMKRDGDVQHIAPPGKSRGGVYARIDWSAPDAGWAARTFGSKPAPVLKERASKYGTRGKVLTALKSGPMAMHAINAVLAPHDPSSESTRSMAAIRKLVKAGILTYTLPPGKKRGGFYALAVPA
jgi:hypothetical protein